MLALTENQEIALQKDHVVRRVFIWVDALTPAGEPASVGYWDDVGDLQIGDRVYHGSGSLIQIAGMSAVSTFSIPGLSFIVAAVHPEVENAVRGTVLAQRPVEVLLGIYDTATRQPILPLIRRFRGVIDDIEYETDPGGDGRIIITAESTSRALTISRTTTRSEAVAKARYPTDRFYEYTGVQREKPVYFGRTAQAPKNTVTGGGGFLGRLFARRLEKRGQ